LEKVSRFNLAGVRKLRNQIFGLFFIALVFLPRGAEPEDLTFLIVVLGTIIRIWASGYLIKKKRLTTWGPYRYVRNPLYLGTFIIGLGLCIVQRSLFFLIIYLAIFTFVYYFQIKYEEKELEAIFGEEYREYCRKVPRLFPRFVPPSGLRTDAEARFNFAYVWKNKGVETLAQVVGVFLVLDIKEDILLPVYNHQHALGEILLHYFRFLF
jgi:hypothetical protein